MSPKAKGLETLLEECGFIERGRWAIGLINTELVKEKLTSYLRYGGLFREAGSETDLIYEVPGPTDEVPGTPCIYFKFTDAPSPEMVVQLRTRIWNHGRIPTLWIVTPNTVRIYDSFARPQAEDIDSPDNHLLGELSRIGDALRNIEEFHKSRFDTGEFWRTGQGRNINPDQRVDSALLHDLSTTEKLFVSQGLDSTTAHALLGRAIFVKYLEDRKILQPSDFHTPGNGNEFRDLLIDKATTYSFFQWLRNTFNGDLFPLSAKEQKDVQLKHLDILQRFLSGHDMSNYPETQIRFWPYSFDIIPIELVSSIYEMFAHARDPELARAISVHYTRFNLVELVLSLGMQNMRHSTRVLDPACGSGVFLVEAFRRLAWLKAKECGRPLNRDELHEILQKQIFGLDIDQDAIYVAAFSLYLALLELDPDPQPPDALRLPPLIENSQQKDQLPNLYIQDFLNIEHEFNQNYPFSNGGFDLITGNPPWTALKKSENIDSNERQWGLEYCLREDIPDNKPDQAFMQRARDFSNQNTRIALVVGSRLFHQSSLKGERWREKFMRNNTLSHVVNLSDLASENLLFGKMSSAGLPASVIVYSSEKPDSSSSLQYIAPKWYPGIRKRDEIVISSTDIQTLTQDLLQHYSFLWKTAFRGTPRDFRLLSRLHELPSLDRALSEAGIYKRIHRAYGISVTNRGQRDASNLLGLPFLASGLKSRYRIDLDDLQPFNYRKVYRLGKFQLPILVLFRALQDKKQCAALLESSKGMDQVIIDHTYYGISFAHTSHSLAFRLNAILNSKAARYFTFMLGYALGWDWRTIEPRDWMQIPLPVSIKEGLGTTWNRVLDLEDWLRNNWVPNAIGRLADNIKQAEEALDHEIFNLYELTDQEIILIKDTITYTIEPFLLKKAVKSILAIQEPTSQKLIDYAKRVCLQLNDILYHGDLQLTATVFNVQKAPLRACRFTLRRRSDATMVAESQIAGIQDLLGQISEHLRSKIADHLYVQRNLRVYDSKTFWIIKPSESRLWSEAAALNDADAIVREHMEQLSNG